MDGEDPKRHPDGPSIAGASSDERAEALIASGMSRYGRGDLEGAVADWEQALALRPGDARAADYLAFVREHKSSLASQLSAMRDTAEFREDDVPLGIAMPPARAAAGADEDDPYAEVELELGSAGGETPAEEHGDKQEEPEHEDEDRDGDEDDGDGGDGGDDGDDDLAEAESPPSEPYAQLSLHFAGDDPLRDTSGEVEIPAAADSDGGGTPSVDDGWEVGAGAGGSRPPVQGESGVGPAAIKGHADISEEETVPGGETPPPLPEGVSLSKEALAALRARAEEIGEHAEDRATKAIVGEVELSDLKHLEAGSIRDDRVVADDRTSSERRDRRDGQDELEDALTTELPRGKLAAVPAAEAGDDDLTLERRAFDPPGARSRRRAPTRDPELPAPVIIDDSLFGDTTVRRWPAGGEPDPGLRDTDPSLAEEESSPSAERAESAESGAQGKGGIPAVEIDDDIDGDATNELHWVPSRSERVLEAAAQASMVELAAAVLAELDHDAPEQEKEDERIRRRVTRIIRRAEEESEGGRHRVAVAALELALEERPDSPVAQKVIHRHRDLLLEIYERYFGRMAATPVLAVPMHQLSARKLDHRTAFLVSRVDGSLSFEEILDVAGMPRLEASRHLARLLFEGILMVR